MSSITLDKFFDLLLENVPVGEEIDIQLKVSKNRTGGWRIEYSPPSYYKVEPTEKGGLI